MRRVVPAPRNTAAVCSACGAAGTDAGPFWESVYKVLDFGGSLPPFEPDDLGVSILCDRCEERRLTEEGRR